jgi:hypothetical protein
MPRKPNYRFERIERERLKDERRAKKEQRKATRDEPGGDAAAPATQEETGNGSS